ncbi:hypothetical protein LRP88_01831 [Fusarium phalaenopsidis]
MDSPMLKTAEAPRSKSSGAQIWHYLEQPKDEAGAMAVVRHQSEPTLPTVHADPGPQSGQPEKQPEPIHPTERIQERSMSCSKKSHETKSPPPTSATFDVVCDPSRPRNATIQVRLPVSPDLDEELEEFNRFVRRGEFGAAKAFFDQYLQIHSAYPWVFVQYAEMLFEMGDYKSLLQLKSEPVFRLISLAPIDADFMALRILQINWELLKASCLCHSQHEIGPVLDEICQPEMILPVSEELGSTQVRITCLAMNLMDISERSRAGAKELPGDLADWGNWESVYRQLQTQGRIWDFRDLFTTACTCFGIKSTEEQFFGSGTIFKALEDDWDNIAADDESTMLAVVDILTTMALLSIRQAEVGTPCETYLSRASSLVEAVISASPSCAKSRPILRFMIAQSSLYLRTGRASHSAYNYLDNFLGFGAYQSEVDLPYYVPIGKENPGWEPPDLPKSSFEPLEMALKASKELKDYQTQAQCLKELALWSREPSEFFEDLARLQTESQEDMEGYLSTCLSRYLVEKDKDAKAKLLKELNGFGTWQATGNLISPDKACARDIIQQALSPSEQISQTQSVKAGLSHYPWITNPFKRFISFGMWKIKSQIQ